MSAPPLEGAAPRADVGLPASLFAESYHQVSTHALKADDRIALWEDYNARVLFDLGVRSLDSRPFEATQRSLRLPQLTFAKVATNPHILERTESHLARSQAEGVMLFFMFAGESFFHHHEGTHIQRPGNVLLCDMSRPFLRGFSGYLQEYVLTVPRAVYEQATDSEVPKAPMLKSFADTQAGAHAAELARLLRRSLNGPDSLDLVDTEQSAIDLLRAMLSTEGGSSSAARRREAVSWIRRNLRDPSLSVTSVSEAIGVSERTLTRTFGETGRGVARTILEMRLELAHEMLTRPNAPQVQEVAARCGFVSAAHFSRVFRARYEATPAEVQQRGRTSA